MRAAVLFAGFGGCTTGAIAAGVSVVYAANHWRLAVETHAANHPRVEHACQDLRQADWRRLPAFDLLIASPSCQPHSTASQPGRRPHHDADRATAWAVVDCAEARDPRAVIVENVPGFRSWMLYPVWRLALERLGYNVTEHVLGASWHGVPQRRERLFVVATKSGRVPVFAPRARELAFGPCIDWAAPGWRSTRRASADARARIRKGQREVGDRFLVHHVTRARPVPLDEPIRTITTKDQWALVDGSRYRPLSMREYARGMGIADSYVLPQASRAMVVRGLGNANPPPLAEDVIRGVCEAA